MSDLMEQLNRAFGARSGGRPQFTAESEGDDYLFGRPPGSKYSGVAALWNGDQHLVDPSYAPRGEWSVINAETIEHDRKPPAADRLDPDCVTGKHPACLGEAWDDATDRPARCECTCHDTTQAEGESR